MHYNLSTPSPGEIGAFCRDIADLAEQHHRCGIRKRPTGRQLTSAFAQDYRAGHIKLASAIYNKTRWSLEAAEALKDEEGR